MLKKIPLARLSFKKKIWEEFQVELDSGAATWVVSDLKTKKLLQDQLLEKREIIWDSPIKRASELWIELARQALPDFIPVGSLGQKALVEKYFSTIPLEGWTQRPGAVITLLEFSRSLAGLLGHDMADEIFYEAQEKFEKQNPFFFEVLSRAREFFHYCISQNHGPHFFLPPLLVLNSEKLPKGGTYYFDLGPAITEGERVLTEELGRENNVVILNLENQKDKNLMMGKIWRCSSPDSEARKAVEQISVWVKQGVKPEDIAVTSKEVSVYENMMSHDLFWEGIGLERELTSPLAGLQFVRRVTSQLKILSGNWVSSDFLEAFENIPRDVLPQLKPVVDLNQLPEGAIKLELQAIENIFYKAFGKNNLEYSYDQFEDLIFLLAERMTKYFTPTDSLLSVLARLRAELAFTTHSFKVWIDSWCDAWVHSDFIYKKSSSGGVWLEDFSSIEEVPASHVIILGLQNSERPRSFLQDLSQEALSFFHGLGFDLSKTEWDWIDSVPLFIQEKKNFILSCSISDQNGSALTPSSYWLKMAEYNNKNSELLDIPEETNWQKIQQSWLSASESVDKIKEWPAGEGSKLFQRVFEDTQKTKTVNLELPNIKLSPSQIENLWQCPFKLLAAQGFALKDEPDLDVDPPPSVRGQILHGAVEKIRREPLENWNRSSLTVLLDELGAKQRQATSDVWPSTREGFLRVLERFINFEMKWQKEFPKTSETLAEVSFDGKIAWNKTKEELAFSKYHDASTDISIWPFRGRLDRIDLTYDNDKLHAVIIDYKDRSSLLSNIPSWQNQGQFQLALYAQALEAGLVNLKQKPNVVGAFYFSLRNMDRSKGFVVGSWPGFLPQDLPKNSQVDKEGRDHFFVKMNQELGKSLEKLEKGEFTPSPQETKKEKICNTCSWRRLCRAQHLL